MEKQDDINFRAFFNDIEDFLFVLDMDGNIIEINEAVTTILGYTREDLMGQSVLLVHPPELRDKAREIVGKMIAGERKSCPLPVLTRNNNYVPVETRVFHGSWKGQDALIGVCRNLSEIALSEDRFFKIFNNSHVLMAISEIETGLFVNVNKQFLQVLGYSYYDIIGRSSVELELFAESQQRSEILKRMVQGERILNEPVVAKTKNGSLLNILFSAETIQIKHSNYLFTSAIDVTQLVVTENKLKQSLSQQTLLADISQKLNSLENAALTLQEIVNLLGNHTNVSRVFIFEDDPGGNTTSNTYDWCNAEIVSPKNKLQHIPYEKIPSWKNMLTEEGNVFSNHLEKLPEDISAILVPMGIKSILCYPMYIQDRYFGFLGFEEYSNPRDWTLDEIELFRTISNLLSNTFERIKFQKLLSESEARLKMAIESTEAGLWDWNIKTGENYFNEIWCTMLGYEASEIIPDFSGWEKLLHPDDKKLVDDRLSKHLRGEAEHFESLHRMLTKSGSWKWILAKGKVIEKDEKGNPLRAIGTHIDLDDQKKIEKELTDANLTKDTFLSIISHDLRGPVGEMVQIAEMLANRENLDDQTFSLLVTTQKSLSVNTFQLLETLLTWARLNSNKLKFNPAKINLREIIDEGIDNTEFLTITKNITVSLAYQGTEMAFADEEMVKLILRNLLSNAVKFTPQSGSISIGVRDAGSLVKIEISDNGVGFAQETISRILSDETFYTTHGTDKEKGVGLGLKLCKDFIAINGGTFQIESESGKGSLFAFSLPKEQMIK